MMELNTQYCEMLASLHRASNGEPPFLSSAISMIFQLRFVASELVTLPTREGVTTASQSFEFGGREVSA